MAAENSSLRANLASTLGIRGWVVRPEPTSYGEHIATYGTNGSTAYLSISNHFNHVEVRGFVARKNVDARVGTIYDSTATCATLAAALDHIN